jgi:uncharacterized membrane protein YbhN (UPF0104 family)
LRASRRRPAAWAFVLGGSAALLTAIGVSAATVDPDSGQDLLGQSRTVALTLMHLRWQFAAAVVALAGLHFVASAVAARASAGMSLPLGETVLVQLAAAAANRLTPAGLGGMGINARYFTRRGLDAPVALGAVAALSILGALADLLVLAAVVAIGAWLHLGGGAHEVALLTTHVSRILGPARSPWLWFGVCALALVAAAWTLLRSGRRPTQWRRSLHPLQRLLRQPRALVVLLGASGCTTLILAFAFIATTAMVPGSRPAAPIGALLVAFMLAAAAGSLVPVPAGLGSTEAALIAVLLSVHVPAAHAVTEVLIFRLITFWLPAVVGLFASRHLYRQRAL